MGEVRYNAQQAADGTWTIFNVPVFAEHTEKLPSGRVFKVDRPWLERALLMGRQREAEGYLPPLHVRHHAIGRAAEEGAQPDVKGAGRWRMRRVGLLPYGGRVVWALFADLVGIRPEVYARIRAGELPYRSVEILRPQTGEVDSLALLDDEVPYFRFPLLRVAERGSPVAAVYAARSEGGYQLSQNFGEGTMGEPIKREDEGSEGDAPPEAEKPQAEAVPAWAQQMLAILQQLAQKLGMGADDGSAMPMGASVTTPMTMGAPTDEGVTRAAAPSAEAGRVEGLLDGMAAKIRRLEGEAAIARQAEGMREKGIAAQHVAKFKRLAEEKGLAYAQGYAASLAENAPQDPPPVWTGEVRQELPDPPEVAQYAQQGPEMLDLARGIWGSWRRYKARGGEQPLGTYLTNNIKQEAAGLAADRS